MEFITRILDKEDRVLIEDLYFKNSEQSDGNINLQLDHSPDIWNSIAVLGIETKILGVIDKQKKHLACACFVSLKECFIQGSLHTVGYMSSLKARKEYYGTLAFARFMRFFNSYWQEANVACWLFSIFSENVGFNKLMSSKRVLLAEVEQIATINTHVFKSGTVSFRKNTHGYDFEIRRAGLDDLSRIENFLEKEHKKRDLITHYSADELSQGIGLLKDLALDNVAIAIKNNEVRGMLGAWDQTMYRRWCVESYSQKYKILRPLLNLGAYLKDLPGLPPAGEPINYKLLCLPIIEDDNPRLFKLLYKELSGQFSREQLFAIGFADQHAFNLLFQNKTISWHNNLYIGYRKQNTELIRSIRKNKLYIELGGL